MVQGITLKEYSYPLHLLMMERNVPSPTQNGRKGIVLSRARADLVTVVSQISDPRD